MTNRNCQDVGCCKHQWGNGNDDQQPFMMSFFDDFVISMDRALYNLNRHLLNRAGVFLLFNATSAKDGLNMDEAVYVYRVCFADFGSEPEIVLTEYVLSNGFEYPLFASCSAADTFTFKTLKQLAEQLADISWRANIEEGNPRTLTWWWGQLQPAVNVSREFSILQVNEPPTEMKEIRKEEGKRHRRIGRHPEIPVTLADDSSRLACIR